MTFLQIIIGAGFRIYESVAQSMNWKTKECWKINRGDLSPVMSCEGNGDPGVNFTIILWAAFLFKSVFRNFTIITVVFVVFFRKNVGAKKLLANFWWNWLQHTSTWTAFGFARPSPWSSRFSWPLKWGLDSKRYFMPNN